MLQSMGLQTVRQYWTELNWNSRERTQLHPSTENQINIYWAWPHPSEQEPVSPSVSLSHQEASISLLSFSITNAYTSYYDFHSKWVEKKGQSVSSVTQTCPTFWDPMNRSTPGLPVHHQLLEFTQIHVHWGSDVIQLSHPLSSPSPALNLSQHQGLFQWVSSSHQVAKVLEFQLQHQSFQWTPRTDFF